MPVNTPTAPAPSSSSNMSAKQETVPADQPQHQFVREKIESTAATVGNVYDSVKNSFGLVSWTLSKAETVASYVVTPVTNVVVDNIGNPILNKVDNVVGTIHDKVFPGQVVQTTTVPVSNENIVELASREKIKLAVDNDWFRHVDEIVSRGFDIKHSFTVFYHAGVESYRIEYDQTKDGNVSFDAFQTRFEKTLHKTWDTRLATAAKTFYNKVANNTRGISKKISHAQLFAGVKEELYQHEFMVIAAFRDQLGQPSSYVYNMSVEAFLQTGPNVSPNTYTNAVKKRLETSWSDALELPIAEFYEGAKTVPTDDLIRFTKTIGARGWTIGDVVNLLDACNEMVSEEVTTKYQKLLRVGQNVVDFVIPDFNKQNGTSQDELDEQAKKLSLTGVVASGPLRVADRVVTGVKLSSEAIAPLIHVDLVKFGENVFESTKNHATTSSAQLSEALNKLKLAMDDMKTVAIKSTKLDYVAEKVSNVTHAVTDPVVTRVDAVTNELDARLTSVASTAKDLSAYSQDYMLNTEIRRFPSDTLSFLSQATNLVIPVEQNQEFSESVVKVQHLLTAIKDVFIWSGKAPATAAPAQ